MPFYSEELIEEVREANDIVDVIGQYVSLSKRGGTYFGLCPFHNEKTGSFSVSQNKQMYYCFGCGEGGNVISFLMKYDNLSFPEALQYLADRAGIHLPERQMNAEERARSDKRSLLLEINREAAKFYYAMLHQKEGELAMKYFRQRQLSMETIKGWGLGYTGQYRNQLLRYLKSKGYADSDLVDAGLISIKERSGAHDRFWNRAIFPIMDVNGRVIAFGGRVMGEGEPKYLNSPETMIFNKSRTLFGLFKAKKTKRPQMILCEGYMDVISMHQNGFDNTVASLGTALTEGHAQILKRYTSEVYLSYDSDAAGTRAALRAIPILRDAGIRCKVIDMQPYKDPDEFMKNLGAEAYEERISKAENAFLFGIRILERDYDMQDPDSNTEFFREVAKRISQFTEEIERNNYMQAIADRYHRSLESIRQLVVHMASQEGILASRKHRRPLLVGAGESKEPYERSNHDRRSYERGQDPDFGQNALGVAQAYADQFEGRRGQRDRGIRRSQRLLLTWMVEEPAVYRAIDPYLGPEDFEPGLYRKIAQMVWEQARKGNMSPARIVDCFRDEDENAQREVALIFNTSVGELTEEEDKEKALKETLLRIKQEALKRKKSNQVSTDAPSLQEIIEDKKKLEALEKIDIHLQ